MTTSSARWAGAILFGSFVYVMTRFVIPVLPLPWAIGAGCFTAVAVAYGAIVLAARFERSQ